MTIKPRFKKEMSLAAMQEEDLRRVAAAKGAGISKSATLIKAPGDGEGTTAGAFSRPTDEQLAQINQFTRTPKTADQLYVFDTLSMNDLPDRDDDVFATETVEGFSALPQPFSPVGKSYMVDHEYKVGNARGRIFATDTVKLPTDMGEATFLRNSIYIPDTPQYAEFIEAQDFGIMWAVSVGVTLGATECTVCGEPFSSWGYWCRQGHDKGLSYDPSSNETDDWGYPLPCDPADPKAVKCLRKFLDPRDFYELSQVFLGAQYYAQLDKTAGFSTAKTAGGFLSVPEKLAKEIEFSHEPQKVQDARRKHTVTLDADGMVSWTDSEGIGWIYDPLDTDTDKVLCVGRVEDKDASDEEDEIEDETNEEVNNDGAATGEELGASDPEGDDEAPEPDEGSGEGGEASEDGSEGGGGSVPVTDDATDSSDDEGSDLSDSSEDDDSGSEDDDEEEKDAPTTDSDKAVKTASPTSLFIALLPVSLRPSAGKTAAEVAKALESHIKALEVKAGLGDEYLVQLRADALSWYARANMQPGERGVKTASFEKLLDRVSDDPSLLREIIEEQKEIAQQRFPVRARRSSAPPADVNEPSDPAPLNDYESSQVSDDESDRVRKRHGGS